MKSYKELDTYQKSIDFVVKVYEATKLFPKSETYALTDQLKRAVVSIPSNIAEGFDRHSSKDFAHFLQIAYGSSAEVETQIIIALKLKYINSELFFKLEEELITIRKMLNKLLFSIKSKSSTTNH